MTANRLLLVVATALWGATASGQALRRDPHVGYLYPAGGQQGTTLQIKAGGQYLQRVSDVYVSGEGVRGSVVEYLRAIRPNELPAILTRLRALAEKARAQRLRPGAGPATPGAGPGGKQEEPPPLPDHPLVRDLEAKTLRELAQLWRALFNPKRQPNAQIAETVLIDISIDPDAAPGDRELRLGTPTGLTNPIIFQVGLLPETCEEEPNDPRPAANLPNAPAVDLPIVRWLSLSATYTPPPVDLPILLNGQIEPGDVDRFRFRARQGQQLVIEARARHLVPYLADAVPGWFQATLALYDADGNELAFADDYRFSPDPVLFYPVPQTGEYELEIRDSIYRGREDFVYRVAVGELPFITQVFPLGGRTGMETIAWVDGWNLPRKQLPLDTRPGADRIRHAALRQDASLSNPVTYAVDDLPEWHETEPNDTPASAQQIELPRIVNGRVARPGDTDVFRFQGRAGEEVVAEVYARRLDSPMDSLLRLTDASGGLLAWNDDYVQKDGDLHRDTGLLTHHADSYLTMRLPEDGVYHVQVRDSQNHGGEAYAYRLHIGPPRPDFALRVSPSSVTVPAGRAAAVWVHALRKDGFDGDIEVRLTDAPAGFAVHGGRIPAGRDSVRMTLTAPRGVIKHPLALQLEGRAVIGGQTVSRPAVPSEDMMQAFLYRHLAPSQELLVKVTGAGRLAPTIELADRVPVGIPAGGTARVRLAAPAGPLLKDLKLELSGPPDGVTLQDVSVIPGGLALLLKADAEASHVGFADNLIVEAFMEVARRGPDGTTTGQKQRVPLGVLPAIPFEVVQG